MLLYNFHDCHLLVASYFDERMNLTLSLFLDIIYLHFFSCCHASAQEHFPLWISCLTCLWEIFFLSLRRSGTLKLFPGFSDPLEKWDWIIQNGFGWPQHKRYPFHQSFVGFTPLTILILRIFDTFISFAREHRKIRSLGGNQHAGKPARLKFLFSGLTHNCEAGLNTEVLYEVCSSKVTLAWTRGWVTDCPYNPYRLWA